MTAGRQKKKKTPVPRALTMATALAVKMIKIGFNRFGKCYANNNRNPTIMCVHVKCSDYHGAVSSPSDSIMECMICANALRYVLVIRRNFKIYES